MQYVTVPEWGNIKVSRLGMGCMRLPTENVGGKQTVHKHYAIELIRAAIDGGINYIDTAYGYHDGDSERIVGEALKEGYRDKVFLATKLPSWNVHEEADMDKLLNEQLGKLQVEHVDFYLLHAVNKTHLANYRKLNYQKFFERAIADGRIGRACFSFHDDAETFIDALNDYDWAMTQIQFNYMDTKNQAGLAGLKAAGQKGVGVVCMEPIRGGALANPPSNIKTLFDNYPVKRSPVEWAFSYVAQFPENRVLLSGMSNMQQLNENLATFDKLNDGPMSEPEKALIEQVEAAYRARTFSGCTACRYCMPCPSGVNITGILRGFDEGYMLENYGGFNFFYNQCKSKGEDASKCVACGACEAACPQKIAIIEKLAQIHEKVA